MTLESIKRITSKVCLHDCGKMLKVHELTSGKLWHADADREREGL